MAYIIDNWFVCLAIFAALAFMVVVGFVSIADALQEK